MTLIEVLVGLAVMAAMALMGRSVIDSMLRSASGAGAPLRAPPAV
ncbi:MAG: hypothetical protein EBW78_03425 [Candidatus Fonsibacter ubiquis]|nr:hypothetical protein [Candidatus Fonsibacter ubiquis]